MESKKRKHLENLTPEQIPLIDFFPLIFNNNSDFMTTISKVSSNHYQNSSFTCDILHQVTKQTPASDELTLDPPIIPDDETSNNLGIKTRLFNAWKIENPQIFTPLQDKLFPHMHAYNDILFTNQSSENIQQLRQLYALHALDHVFKSKDKTLKNTTKLKMHTINNTPIPEYRDQGFTKPKVLVLLPFKSTALEFIQTLLKISGTSQHDYQNLFSGNNDDHFRIGLKFSRKQVSIYSNFYSSDILVASPLGLRMIIGSEGEKKRDFDFLSSIEMVILDQTDVFMMQNWEHVLHIFDHLNLVPKESHDCDFSRVRSYYLDGQAKHFRQTLVFSKQNSPELNSLYKKHFSNIVGRLKFTRSFSGTIHETLAQVPQVFYRFDSENPSDDPDARFKFFISKTLPTLVQSVLSQDHTLIFIPSYFDYVRIRNHFKKSEHSYDTLCEYTKSCDISRTRGEFFRGNVSFLLYTERFHFFRRYNIRGVKHVLFYGLPENDLFYPEILNNLENSDESTVTAIYSKYDRMRLERIIGSKNIEKMCNGIKDTFMFT